MLPVENHWLRLKEKTPAGEGFVTSEKETKRDGGNLPMGAFNTKQMDILLVYVVSCILKVGRLTQ